MPKFDYTGVTPSAGGNFDLIPEAWYPWNVIDAEEGESSAGEYQVKVFLGCADGVHDTNIQHYVTFKDPTAKGAGMALHFLKCIDQPYEGEFEVSPLAWVGKKFMGKVKHEEYNGQKRNKLASISPMRVPPLTEQLGALKAQSPKDDETIPF